MWAEASALDSASRATAGPGRAPPGPLLARLLLGFQPPAEQAQGQHHGHDDEHRHTESLGLPAATPEVEDLARLLLAVGPGGALARAAEGEAFRDELMEETNVALAQRLLRGLPGHDARGGAQ
jgi:hypothetical protein